MCDPIRSYWHALLIPEVTAGPLNRPQWPPTPTHFASTTKAHSRHTSSAAMCRFVAAARLASRGSSVGSSAIVVLTEGGVPSCVHYRPTESRASTHCRCRSIRGGRSIRGAATDLVRQRMVRRRTNRTTSPREWRRGWRGLIRRRTAALFNSSLAALANAGRRRCRLPPIV